MATLRVALAALMLGFALAWFLKPAATQTSIRELEPSIPHNTENQHPTDSTARANTEPARVEPIRIRASAASNEPEAEFADVQDQFMQLLKSKRYRAAVDLYADIERKHSELALLLRQHVLAQLREKLKFHNFDDFNHLAQNWLASYYKDVDALLLLADCNRLLGHFGEAIATFQLMYNYGPFEERQKIDAEFDNFVSARDDFLVENEEWIELQIFYELLERAGIAKNSQRYRLAEIYFNNGYSQDAALLAQKLLESPQYHSRAESLLQHIEDADETPRELKKMQQQTIPLQRVGHHYLATLTLPGNVSLILLLDTGASTTTLSSQAFHQKIWRQQAYREGDTRLFNTAAGTVKGSTLQVPAAYLGSYKLRDVEIAVLPMEGMQGIDGLLGMNILSQFRFQIDQEKAELVLEKLK